MEIRIILIIATSLKMRILQQMERYMRVQTQTANIVDTFRNLYLAASLLMT